MKSKKDRLDLVLLIHDATFVIRSCKSDQICSAKNLCIIIATNNSLPGPVPRTWFNKVNQISY